ncbi:MAG: peptidoglycan DD-metalloendopeptidase family protein [Bdellovibrionales bacterium]|nr:peptidoglycan DD-metalloendopeptidase family protein [Bdellovibrionales bacterium]
MTQFTNRAQFTKGKLTAFIVLLFLLQGAFFGYGFYQAKEQQAVRIPVASDFLPSFIENPGERVSTEARASYFDWNTDFSNPALQGELAFRGDPLKYTVKSGDTLSAIWTKLGGSVDHAQLAAKAFKAEGVPLSSLRAGEELLLHLNSNGEIAHMRKELSEGRILSLELREHSYHAHILNPEIVTTQRTVTGSISHSLAASALQEGIPYEIIDEFIDLFSGRLEFSRETQRGDTFTVIYDERNAADGRPLTPGTIHAASFMNKGELMVAIRHEAKNGEVHYYDREGKPIGNHFLRYPVQYTRISSLFTNARFHPVLKRWRPHNGVDFAAPTGTPVRSVADGIVEQSGYSGGNGNMVKIRHGDKYATAYLHLSRISKDVRKGSRVKRGQVIGAVGSTGLATGPHLHYSFYVNGKYVDPMNIKLPRLPDKFEPIPDKLLKATLRRLKKHHRQVQLASSEGSQATANG